MTISLLPLQVIKLWPYRIILHFYIHHQTENREFIRPKIHKTRILPEVGNMTLLPNPGEPVFLGVSFHLHTLMK